jgi:hypothetical protein
MKYALYVGDEDDHPNVPAAYSDSLDDLRAKAVPKDSATYYLSGWYEIVDISSMPFKSVEQGTLSDLRESLCFHVNTYRVEEPGDDGGGIIVSGVFGSSGVYCRDCGKRLGDLT